MPCSSAEEFVALDGFERGEGRDEIDQGEAMTTDESTISRATRPQTLSVNRDGDEIDFRPINHTDEPDGTTNPAPSRDQFTDSRNFVRQLCDASLLAANVSQLRAVLDNGSGNSYFIPLLVMIALSMICHVVFGILMIQRWRKAREAQKEHRMNNNMATTPQSQASSVHPEGVLCSCAPCMKVEKYDEISMYFMFLVVILNVGIAGLGLSGPKKVTD
mmetsp:Transcript_24165/g.39167  ORF Transcript_24165/g.39167 Transcript_24165/m.39167 type:complete len:217 (+) Transcript_24165:8-658(+)